MNSIDAVMKQEQTCIFCGCAFPEHDESCEYRGDLVPEHAAQELATPPPSPLNEEAPDSFEAWATSQAMDTMNDHGGHEEHAGQTQVRIHTPPPAPRSPAPNPRVDHGAELSSTLDDVRQHICRNVVMGAYTLLTVMGKLKMSKVMQMLSSKHKPASEKEHKLKQAVKEQFQRFRERLHSGVKLAFHEHHMPEKSQRKVLMHLVKELHGDMADVMKKEPGDFKIFRGLLARELLSAGEIKELTSSK